MRIVVLLLLLANLTLFAYTRLDSAAGGEGAARAAGQPDKIKLLTPQQVAALGPAKIAALADVCIEWGPFADAERARALAELEPLALGRLLTQKQGRVDSAFWVNVGPVAKAAARTSASASCAAGLKDCRVVDAAARPFAISLGAFRTEAGGARVRRGARAKGRRQRAKVVPRQQALVADALVVRDPEQPWSPG